MSDLESLQAFENDSVHYVALMDRALAQLKRVLNDEEMGFGYNVINHLGAGLRELGGQITEYVQTKRTKIFREIDEEAGRTKASREAAVKGQGKLKDAQGVHTGAGIVSASRL